MEENIELRKGFKELFQGRKVEIILLRHETVQIFR